MKGDTYIISAYRLTSEEGFKYLSLESKERITFLGDNFFVLTTDVTNNNPEKMVLSDLGDSKIELADPVSGKSRKVSLKDKHWQFNLYKFVTRGLSRV